MKKHLIEFWLSYYNDFISVQGTADYYGLTRDETFDLLKIGRKYHNEQVEIQRLKNI